MLKSILPTLALAATVLSASTPQAIVAKFDDITVVPGAPLLNTIGIYEGLNYTGFAVNEVGVDGAAQEVGIKPQSGSQNLVSGVEQTDEAQPVGFSVRGTGHKSFDLHSFYYGCSVNTAEGAEGVASTCTIIVQGYKTLTSQRAIAEKTTTFKAPVVGGVAKPFKAVFPKDFEGVQKVRIRQLESTTGEALNVIVVDNVAYTLH